MYFNGFGNCLLNVDTERTLIVSAFQVETIVGNGISIRDAQSFLETASGIKLFTDSTVIAVPPSGVCFLPAGFLATPLSFEGEANHYFVSLPCLRVGATKALSAEGRAALIKSSADVFDKMKPEASSQQEVVEAFGEFVKRVSSLRGLAILRDCCGVTPNKDNTHKET